MTRPKKQTVDYFPHSCNHGKTMFIIEQKWGNDGYAFWFKLLELLGTAEGHYLDLNNEASWEFLQAKTRTRDSFCNDVLNMLAKLGAIDPELWLKRVVWIKNFVDGVSIVYQNRRVEIPKRPDFYIQKSGADIVSTDTETKIDDTDDVSTRRKPHSRVEESKVEENNENAREENSSSDGFENLDATETERETLHVLQSVSGYLMDYTKDLDFLRQISIDFPAVNIPAEVRAWRIYKLDKPLNSKSNPRSQFRHWCEIANKKTGPSPQTGQFKEQREVFL